MKLTSIGKTRWGAQRFLKSGSGRRFLMKQLAHYFRKNRFGPRERGRTARFYADNDLHTCAQ